MIKEHTPEEIKNRLSNIGEAIGNIALEYITELVKENEEMKEDLGCETCQIHLEYMRLNDKINDLEKENRLLGERCNQLLKDKGDLTDQIADIKANCDLAIEGRDIKIKELELKLTVEKDQHQEEINLHLHAEDYIKSLEKENAELKNQVEKHKWNDIFLEDCTGYDKKIAEEYTTLQERIEKLERENAGLKAEKGCETCTKFDEIKLTKAKEMIKNLYEGLDKLYLSGLSAKQIAFIERLQDKTEQFLKEIEK